MFFLSDRLAVQIRNILADHSVKFTKIDHKLEAIMATLDDIVADEAALKTANGQLIQIAANTLAALVELRQNPGIDPAAGAKIDALHSSLTSDLNDVTAAITADSTPVEPPPAGPVEGTGGQTGEPDTSLSPVT